MSRETTFPDLAAVFVVYANDRVHYIGSTNNLRRMMNKTWRYKDDDPVLRGKVVDVKFSVSRRYGDWLMREARLIKRLKPRMNMRNRR